MSKNELEQMSPEEYNKRKKDAVKAFGESLKEVVMESLVNLASPAIVLGDKEDNPLEGVVLTSTFVQTRVFIELGLFTPDEFVDMWMSRLSSFAKRNPGMSLLFGDNPFAKDGGVSQTARKLLELRVRWIVTGDTKDFKADGDLSRVRALDGLQAINEAIHEGVATWKEEHQRNAVIAFLEATKTTNPSMEDAVESLMAYA